MLSIQLKNIKIMKIKADYVNEPQWKILTVKATLPEELKCLNEMAHNMWWCGTTKPVTCSATSMSISIMRRDTTP